MKLPPFNEQRDKIIQAYFKDEIKPHEPNFCFCGTLCDGKESWFGIFLTRHHDFGPYKGIHFLKMEKALFAPLIGGHKDYRHDPDIFFDLDRSEEYEERLFQGLSAALDVLKQIHIEHGEVIDEVPVFTKRTHPKCMQVLDNGTGVIS